jgi:hypothetical protein
MGFGSIWVEEWARATTVVFSGPKPNDSVVPKGANGTRDEQKWNKGGESEKEKENSWAED